MERDKERDKERDTRRRSNSRDSRDVVGSYSKTITSSHGDLVRNLGDRRLPFVFALY